MPVSKTHKFKGGIRIEEIDGGKYFVEKFYPASLDKGSPRKLYSVFHKDSFRRKQQKNRDFLYACPKAAYAAGQCAKGMVLLQIYHPVKELKKYLALGKSGKLANIHGREVMAILSNMKKGKKAKKMSGMDNVWQRCKKCGKMLFGREKLEPMICDTCEHEGEKRKLIFIYLGGKLIARAQVSTKLSLASIKKYWVEELGYDPNIEVVSEPKKGMSGLNAKMNAYDVYLDGQLIDTVFDESMDAEDVKNSLIGHDGYDPAIEVVPAPKRRKKPAKTRQYTRTYPDKIIVSLSRVCMQAAEDAMRMFHVPPSAKTDIYNAACAGAISAPIRADERAAAKTAAAKRALEIRDGLAPGSVQGLGQDEECEIAYCPVCDGEGVPMGSLGWRVFYSCRDCGMEFSHEIEKPKKSKRGPKKRGVGYADYRAPMDYPTERLLPVEQFYGMNGRHEKNVWTITLPAQGDKEIERYFKTYADAVNFAERISGKLDDPKYAGWDGAVMRYRGYELYIGPSFVEPDDETAGMDYDED